MRKISQLPDAIVIAMFLERMLLAHARGPRETVEKHLASLETLPAVLGKCELLFLC